MPRLHVALPLHSAAIVALPPGAARHVQVLRLQPGNALTLFNGEGGEWSAEVVRIGRSEVEVRIGDFVEIERELDVPVTLALGMPANDRMDALIEKATELGVVAIQPLICERSVLRLAGERATKKLEHWQGVAVAASEQSGRTRVPRIQPVTPFADWLRKLETSSDVQRFVLSLRADAKPLTAGVDQLSTLFLSGPEGGLTEAEEDAAREAGFMPASLGPRVLRADTAPLAALILRGSTS